MSKAWVGVGFLAGVATGILASQQYFENKYRQIAEVEIESVKEAFRKDRPTPAPKKKPKEKAETAVKPDTPKYTNYQDVRSNKNKYQTASETLAPGEEPVVAAVEPVVIPPESFGENQDYEQISLTYYADGVLAGEDDKRMTADEIRNTVGADSLTRFGEYEDDSVFVRNDALKCEYEILMDHRTYREMLKTMPASDQED